MSANDNELPEEFVEQNRENIDVDIGDEAEQEDDDGSSETSTGGGGAREPTLDRGTTGSDGGGDTGSTDDTDAGSSETSTGGGGAREPTLDSGTSGTDDSSSSGSRSSDGPTGSQDRERSDDSPRERDADSSSPEEQRPSPSPADNTSSGADIPEDEVERQLKESFAEETPLEKSDVELRETKSGYELAGGNYVAEVGRGDIRESIRKSVAEESDRFGERALVVEESGTGFSVGVTDEAESVSSALAQQELEAAMGGNTAQGSVDLGNRDLAGAAGGPAAQGEVVLDSPVEETGLDQEQAGALGADASQGDVDTTSVVLPDEQTGGDSSSLDMGVDDPIQNFLASASETVSEYEQRERLERAGETAATFGAVVPLERRFTDSSEDNPGPAEHYLSETGRAIGPLADPAAYVSGGLDVVRFSRAALERRRQERRAEESPIIGREQFEERLETIADTTTAAGNLIYEETAEAVQEDPVGTAGRATGLLLGGFAAGTAGVKATRAGRREFSRVSRLFDDDRAMAQLTRGGKADVDGDQIELERERPPDADEPTPEEWVEARTKRPDEDLRDARSTTRKAPEGEQPETDLREVEEEELAQAADELAEGQPSADARSAFPEAYPAPSAGLLRPPTPRGPRVQIDSATSSVAAAGVSGRTSGATAATIAEASDQRFGFAAVTDFEEETELSQTLEMDDQVRVLDDETTAEQVTVLEDGDSAIEADADATLLEDQTTEAGAEAATENLVQTEMQAQQGVSDDQQVGVEQSTSTTLSTEQTQTTGGDQTTGQQPTGTPTQPQARQGQRFRLGGGIGVGLGPQLSLQARLTQRPSRGGRTRNPRPDFEFDLGVGGDDDDEFGFVPTDADETMGTTEPGWFAETLEGFAGFGGAPEPVDPGETTTFGLELPTEGLVDPEPDREEDVEDVLDLFGVRL